MKCKECDIEMQTHPVHEIADLHFCDICHKVLLSDEMGVTEYKKGEFHEWEEYISD